MKYFIIKRRYKAHNATYHTKTEYISDKGYHEYIQKHGYHFTDALAEHASKSMVNSNGTPHSWTVSQVKRFMETLNLDIPNCVTVGDITYLANMYYADLFPEVIKDEASCFYAAHKIAHDVDGYNGMIFCRWLADIVKKEVKINWSEVC